MQIGADVAAAFVPVVRLNAGEGCVWRMSEALTPYAKADTAAVILERLIIDD